MERLRCFDGTAGCAAENQNANRARLLQTRRRRKSLGRFRGTALTLSIYNASGERAMITTTLSVIFKIVSFEPGLEIGHCQELRRTRPRGLNTRWTGRCMNAGF